MFGDGNHFTLEFWLRFVSNNVSLIDWKFNASKSFALKMCELVVVDGLATNPIDFIEIKFSDFNRLKQFKADLSLNYFAATYERSVIYAAAKSSSK